MRTETTVRCHYSAQIRAARAEHTSSACRRRWELREWPSWEASWQLLLMLPYSLAIPLLAIYPKETKTCPHTTPKTHENIYNSFVYNFRKLNTSIICSTTNRLWPI